MEAVYLYLQDLLAGDPVAWTFTGVVLGLFLLFCIFWLKIARDLRREDEKRKGRRKDSPAAGKRPGKP